MAELCYCEKCNKMMAPENFYTYKDGRKTEMCKKCLTLHIDNFDESTYLWLLEKMDVPYLPEEWKVLRDKAYAKDPFKMNGMSVFGKYLSKMKLNQYRDPVTKVLYGWADSAMLREKYEGKKAEVGVDEEAIQNKRKLIQEQFDAGEISEAQYQTLIDTEVLNNNRVNAATSGGANPYIGENNAYNENAFMDENELPDPAGELTKEDKIYLAMKWGRLYKPNEWVELERKYIEMTRSFDIQDADTINSLILLCKTDLKMNQSIDCGDLEGYQKLSRVYDSLRKSMKLTAAQNKEEKGNFVDSIGEMVVLCEREEGFIPTYATDIPQDKVDLTLNDMNNYVYKLVTQNLGFGQQIEDALKKIQIQKEMNAEAEKHQNDNFEDNIEELIDENYEEFYSNIQKQKEEDMNKLKEG